MTPRKSRLFALVAMLLLLHGAIAQSSQDLRVRDKILFNAKIFTANRNYPFAEAIAISGKSIVAIGNLDEVKKKMPAGTPLYDMGGQFVMPGFVDSHNHALQGGESLLKAYVDDSLVSAADLEAFARASKENGKGMRGHFLVINGLNITTWSHIPELQATFNGNDYAKQPVLLRGSDGHTGWGNRAMLAEAGITKSFIQSLSADQRKFFGFDSSFEPNGFIADDGFDKFSELIPPAALDPMAIGKSAFQYNNALGITAWLDPSAGNTSDKVNKTLALYARMSAAGLLSAHIATTVVADANGNAQAQIQQVKALQHQFNVIPNLSVLGFKIFADGVIEYPTQTAALSKPYTNNGSYGVLMVNPSKFNGFVVAADKQGLLVHVHAIGDEAVTVALNGFEKARTINGDSKIPHTITHLQVLKPADFVRFKALGVLASVQLLWALGDPTTIDIVKPYIAPELYRYQYPARSMLQAGATLCGASDWPVSTANPFIAMFEAETRLGKMGVLDSTQTVPRTEMLYAYTINAAKALRMEKKIGSLEPGKIADLIIVDRDVMNVNPMAFRNSRILITIFEGQPVYVAP